MKPKKLSLPAIKTVENNIKRQVEKNTPSSNALMAAAKTKSSSVKVAESNLGKK